MYLGKNSQTDQIHSNVVKSDRMVDCELIFNRSNYPPCSSTSQLYIRAIILPIYWCSLFSVFYCLYEDCDFIILDPKYTVPTLHQFHHSLTLCYKCTEYLYLSRDSVESSFYWIIFQLSRYVWQVLQFPITTIFNNIFQKMPLYTIQIFRYLQYLWIFK